MKKIGELTYEILANANIGLWAIELDKDEKPRMYADDTMLRLLGISEGLTPEEVYNAWYENIHIDAYDDVQAAVDKMVNGEHAEVQYPWHHPTKGEIYVRCGGLINKKYTKGIRLEGCHQDVTQLYHIQKEYARIEKELEEEQKKAITAMDLAVKDPLTGLYNRQGFNTNAVALLEKNKNTGIYTAVMYIDMDRLKEINDNYGHDDGDYCIKAIGRILSSIVKGRGVVGRFGGDEFAAVVSLRGKDGDASFFKNQIEGAFLNFNSMQDKEYELSVSVGIEVLAPSQEISFEEALNLADEKLYEEKRIKKTLRMK